MNSILIYVLIFVVKVFEVTISTTKIVLIKKGEREKRKIIGIVVCKGF